MKRLLSFAGLLPLAALFAAGCAPPDEEAIDVGSAESAAAVEVAGVKLVGPRDDAPSAMCRQGTGRDGDWKGLREGESLHLGVQPCLNDETRWSTGKNRPLRAAIEVSLDKFPFEDGETAEGLLADFARIDKIEIVVEHQRRRLLVAPDVVLQRGTCAFDRADIQKALESEASIGYLTCTLPPLPRGGGEPSSDGFVKVTIRGKTTVWKIDGTPLFVE